MKLLRIFFRDPAQIFFVRELTRLLDVQINAVRRELLHLTRSGIISAVTDELPAGRDGEEEDPHEAKRKYYRLNQRSVLFPELQALLLKSHLLGEQSIVSACRAAGDVDVLLFTGIFANVSNVPTDILIVGDISERAVGKIIADFEHEHGTQIRYTILSSRDYIERRQLTDRFLYAVLDAPHQVAINTLAPL